MIHCAEQRIEFFDCANAFASHGCMRRLACNCKPKNSGSRTRGTNIQACGFQNNCGIRGITAQNACQSTHAPGLLTDYAFNPDITRRPNRKLAECVKRDHACYKTALHIAGASSPDFSFMNCAAPGIVTPLARITRWNHIHVTVQNQGLRSGNASFPMTNNNRTVPEWQTVIGKRGVCR